MAVTSKSVQPAEQPAAPAEQPKAPVGDEQSKTKQRDGYSCVVPDSDPTRHMGRAVPGSMVCSAHTMRYLADGTPRDARAAR